MNPILHLLPCAVIIFQLTMLTGSAGEAAKKLQHKTPTTDMVIPLGEKAPPLPVHGWIKGTGPEPHEFTGKYILLYFFQPGCGSCDAFTLHLRRLQLRNRNRLVAVGIADRELKDLQAVTGGINRVYHFLRDPGKTVTAPFLGKIDVLPAYCLLDPAGRLCWVDQGQYRLPLSLELDRLMALSNASGSRRAAKPAAHNHRKKSGIRRLALVIGIGRDPLSGKTLALPRADALAVSRRFRRMGFTRVELLTDAPASPEPSTPVAGNITRTLKELCRAAGTQSELIVFFSGSGLQKGKGSRIDVDLFTAGAGQNSLSLRALANQVAQAGCRSLFLLDVGHAEAGIAPYAKLTGSLDNLIPRSTVIFSCSGRNGLAWPQPATTGKKPEHSRFAAALLEALSVKADLDHDRIITTTELFRHVWLKLNNLNRYQDNKQNPFASGLLHEQQVTFPLPRHP